MKKALMLLICLTMTYSLWAQEQVKVKQKEFGLVFSNLDNFGLTFKTGTDKSLWRFNALFMSGSNSDQITDSSENNYNNMGFGIKLGRECRKVAMKNLEFRFGADISFSYSHNKSDYNDKSTFDFDRVSEQTTYIPGINLVFGLNYVINNKFVFGAELLPYFNYSTSTNKTKFNDAVNFDYVKTETSGFNYGLTNSSALLSVSYRF